MSLKKPLGEFLMSLDFNRIKWWVHLAKTCRMAALFLMAFGRSRKKSVLFFTQHKAASTFVTNILEQLSRLPDPLRHVNYSSLLGDLGAYVSFGKRFPNEHDWYCQYAPTLFKRTGCVYGPFRYPFFIRDCSLFKKIIFLRDPRDALISRYYSFGFSHGIPKDSQTQKWFLNERERIQAESIDAYCLRMATEWSAPMLDGYMKMIRQSVENPLVIIYEDYVKDPGQTIRQIFDYCGVEAPEKAISELIRQAKPVSESVTVTSHKRSGRSGQYLQELRPETIVGIEMQLKNELEFFGWKQ